MRAKRRTAGADAWVGSRGPTRWSLPIRLAGLLFLVVIVGGSRAQTPEASPVPVATPATMGVETFSAERVQELLTAARDELAKIPAEAAEDSLDGQRRLHYTRRANLATEFLEIAGRRSALAEDRAGLEKRLAEAESSLAKLAKAPSPAAPGSPDRAGFDQLGTKVAQQRQGVTTLRESIRTRQARVTDLATQLAAADARATEAAKRLVGFEDQRAATTDEATRKILEIRIGNARLDRRVAQASSELLRETADLGNALVPVLNKELELAELQLSRLDAEFTAYGKALEAHLAKAQDKLAATLARDQEKAEQADTPEARLLAAWTARIGLARKAQAETEGRLLVLRREVVDQQKRLATEEEELANLRELLRSDEAASRASTRVRAAFRLLERRRASLHQVSRAGYETDLEAQRTRRFEIDDLLIDLPDRAEEELETALSDVEPGQRARVRGRADTLLAQTRDALRDEKSVLTEAIVEGQRLQGLLAKRLSVLGETERFLRSKAFWLRDAPDLVTAIRKSAPGEILRLTGWMRRVQAMAHPDPEDSGVARARLMIQAILAIVILPCLFLLGRRRLKALLAAWEESGTGGRHALVRRLAMIVAGLLGACLFPAYLQALSLVVGSAGDTTLAPVVSAFLDHLSRATLLFLLARAIFLDHGVARVHFGMGQEVAAALRGALQAIALGYAILLMPWSILSAPPFELTVLPRLAYFLFEAAAGIVLYRLLREDSGLVGDQDGPLLRHRGKAALALGLLLSAILLFDALGYRFTAGNLAASLVETLMVLLVLPALHLLTQSAISAARRAAIHAAHPPIAGPGGEGGSGMASLAEEQAAIEAAEKAGAGARPGGPVATGPSGPNLAGLRHAVRLAFLALGAILVARAWGIDQGAVEALGSIQIYTSVTAAGVEDVLTATHLVKALFVVGLTVALVTYLPGLCDAFVFPRLGLDQGLNYAILSLLRYGLSVAGAIFALAAIKVDLSRLGWLMGALSVGLGFGLQEIVSNFVCGLILLIERPVRVGDVITVGGKSGTVTRINIRATTILNFDRQEEILPNRSFITGDVTNWTRGDTINRVVIPIGVAYGSDVDKVTDILLRIARSTSGVLLDPAPSVVFFEHGDSALLFNVRVFVPNPGELMTTRDRINKAINKTFAREGIEIPFPQRDLHIRSSSVPLGILPVSTPLGEDPGAGR